MWCERWFNNERKVPIFVTYADGTKDTIYPSPEDPNTNYCLLQIANQHLFEPNITCPFDPPYTSVCPIAIAIQPIKKYIPGHGKNLREIFRTISPWVIKDLGDNPDPLWSSLFNNSISPEQLHHLLTESNDVKLLISAKVYQILCLSDYPFPNPQK